MDNQKLLIGALAGLVAGVTIGLLLAPGSGGDTRKNIADTAGNWGANLRKRFKSLTGSNPGETDPWVEHHRAKEGMADPGYTS